MPDPLGGVFDRAPVPASVLVNARGAAGLGAVVLCLLLIGLYIYRRRPYILQWAVAWLLIATSLALMSRDWMTIAGGRAVIGLAQLLNLWAALIFVLSADSIRQQPRFTLRDLWFVVPLILWFGLAPVPLGLHAVLVPGYFLTAAMYLIAALAFALLFRTTRLVGAAALTVTFLLLAVVHGWLMYAGARDFSSWNTSALSALVPAALVALVAGLAMHVLVFEDITWELRQTNRRLEAAQVELEQLVITDPLTGCHNRRFFHAVIGRELQRRWRYNTPLSVLFVDVDRFKAVNDTLGHEVGDAVLQRVADFLRRNVREADYLFRWGGDEFLVLIACSGTEAERKASDLQEAFADSIAADKYPDGFGLSIGSAESPADTRDVMTVIREADARMYRVKSRDGRARRRARA